MLPAFLTSTRSLTLGATMAALIATTAAEPAMAWGVKEQNFVAGVATTLLLEGIFAPQMFQPKPRYPARGAYPYARQPAQQPVYYTPAPTTTSIYSTPAATAFNSYAQSEQVRIQSKLAALGYYHSTIDGSFGPNTFNAVTAYASSTGKTSLLGTPAGAFTLYDSLLF